MNQKSPKYASVLAEITSMVKNAQVGTVLPPERELAAALGTSRTTVRQALAALASTGHVERAQGSGTVVAEPKRVIVHQLTSYSDDLRSQGYTPDSRIIRVRREQADTEVGRALGQPAGTKVTVLERVRYLDEEPLAVEVAHLPGTYPGLRREVERHGSLYDTLKSVYGITVGSVSDIVDAAPAAPHEATLLDIAVGAPLLAVRRTTTNEDNDPVEFTRSFFRGDRFSFVAFTPSCPGLKD